MKKNILIISTDATRTGTPVLLLNFLKWLKQNSDYNYVLLFQDGGEMLSEFKSLCEVHLWNDLKKDNIQYFLYRLIKKFFSGLKNVKVSYKPNNSNEIRKLFIHTDFDLIISNTARNGNILSDLKDVIIDKKLIVYVHEGERTLDLFNSNGAVTYNLLNCNKIIAVSETIKTMLERKFNLNVPIEVISGGIDDQNGLLSETKNNLNKFGITDNKKVIMSCGWLGWLKGVDFFILIANKLSKIDPDLQFVWLGGNESDKLFYEMNFDIERYNLKNCVTIITSKEDSMKYIAECDLFLMLSREESLSLVTIEAAFLNKVVLSFDKSGGPNEIMNYDKNYIVDYGDIDQMCDRILLMLNNKELYNQLSTNLRKRILENYTIQMNAPKLLKLIDDELN